MAGVLQGAIPPVIASLAGDGSSPLADGHSRFSVLHSGSSRYCTSRGRVFCTNPAFNFQQKAPASSPPRPPPPASPPPVDVQNNPPPPPSPTPQQLDASPASHQGWPRLAQGQPQQENQYYPAQHTPYAPPQYQTQHSPYRPKYSQPLPYQGQSPPYQGQSPQYQTQRPPPQYENQQPQYQGQQWHYQSQQPSQYQSQPWQYQGQQPPHQSQPSHYQSQPPYQSQALHNQPMQDVPTQYQNPTYQYQTQPTQQQNQPSQYQTQPIQYQNPTHQYQTQPTQQQNQPSQYKRAESQFVQTGPSLQGPSSFESLNNQPMQKTPQATSSTSPTPPPLTQNTGGTPAAQGPSQMTTSSQTAGTSSSTQASSQTTPKTSSTQSTFPKSAYTSMFDDESQAYHRAAMSNVRRRPYDPEAKMRMKQYRREALIRQRQQELENLEKNYKLDRDALYQKGNPGTVLGIVRDINTVGYYVKLPDGREGFLPCMQFNDNCPGGIPLLTRLFNVGDEITVRQEKMYDGGLDKLYVRPDVQWESR